MTGSGQLQLLTVPALWVRRRCMADAQAVAVMDCRGSVCVGRIGLLPVGGRILAGGEGPQSTDGNACSQNHCKLEWLSFV